jgi:(E)-4-hydroxy-3-methylbut-2-enyl-diphosphate synthase
MKTEVRIRDVVIGGRQPVAVQSMADCSTLDTVACVELSRRLRAAGCRIVRFTVQGPREAANLENIRAGLDAAGLGDVAMVADVHFNPRVALLAAEHADKVRINPGNFGGAGEEFLELLDILRRRGAALRVGVNHGSLAPRIVERWGDTPEGMAESAMEYLRVCVAQGFDQVVVSMKSSNVRVMVRAYRLLEAAMEAEGMAFPLHLGVTEAGDGDAARVKSAVGIGTLLAEGLGDTVRVSLTEPPENEIPVAQAIIDCFPKPSVEPPAEYQTSVASADTPPGVAALRRFSAKTDMAACGGPTGVLWEELSDAQKAEAIVLDAEGDDPAGQWRRAIAALENRDGKLVILRRRYDGDPLIPAAAEFGGLFVDGLADGLHIVAEGDTLELGLMILQAARVRMTTTEYIACPGCGRTLYDLRGTLAAIKERTKHMPPGLKIGVMGCIVNGPGEMADADYGYVGEGPGRITLYKGCTVVRRAIPQQEAIDALIELISGEI